MIRGIQLCVTVIFIRVLVIAADTHQDDVAALNALKFTWKNLPPNWQGSDPCGSRWEGITCNNISRVTAIKLGGIGIAGNGIGDISSFTALEHLDLSNNLGLTGTIPQSIGNLKNLQTLILIGCGFNGQIPDSIGSLSKLVYLSLNSNKFIGQIPPSIGNLSNISWLDLSYNQLTGPIPVSNETAPGLDMLLKARHFHLSMNKLSGPIPPRLFSSNMSLIHVLFDNNQLVGTIPQTLGLVRTLEAIRLDWNLLSGSVPSLFNDLPNVTELYLSNNNLIGAIPNLTGMSILSYVDLSNNSFDESVFPQSFTSLQSLTTLVMENTKLNGPIPVNFFSLPQLQRVVLKENKLNESLDIGDSFSKNITLDLQNNLIDNFKQKSTHSMTLTLIGNPICRETGVTDNYCTVQKNDNSFLQLNTCMQPSSDRAISPSCDCTQPYTGRLCFFSYSFSDFGNSSYFSILHAYLRGMLNSSDVSMEGFNVRDPLIGANSYLQYNLQFNPLGQDIFNRTVISSINFLINRQNPLLPALPSFGPFFFLEDKYCCFSGDNKKSSNTGIIVGASIGVSVAVLLIIGASLYAFRKRRRARTAINKSTPFASWDPDKGNGGVPQLKGTQWFSFEELRKLTDNFSESNCIGVGGYGKVYRGALTSGQLVAIKRAQQGSMQGATEFKTEIELLSRIHHKNVVSLVGFCYEQGEQMLVYEYIPNGTLRESLSGKSGIRLNWMRRLRIGLDAAKGILYLHELADPPIIHRDIKSNNILLDDKLTAKVADFGLSKLMGDNGKGYVSTQVKGTMGYLDPEYYMTQQLTEKSDVFSFGVVLLELVTSRAPIERGKYIVRLIQEALDNPNDLRNLYEMVDPALGPGSRLGGFEKFIDLAMSCVREAAADRPTMGEVTREIENIMELANSNLPTEN